MKLSTTESNKQKHKATIIWKDKRLGRKLNVFISCCFENL